MLITAATRKSILFSTDYSCLSQRLHGKPQKQQTNRYVNEFSKFNINFVGRGVVWVALELLVDSSANISRKPGVSLLTDESHTSGILTDFVAAVRWLAARSAQRQDDDWFPIRGEDIGDVL